VADQKKPQTGEATSTRGGLATLLVGALVTALVALVVFIGNGIRDDISRLNKKQETLLRNINQLDSQNLLLIERLNDRFAGEIESICISGQYDASNRRCTFTDGRPPLEYKRLEYRPFEK
jgi:predicted PurR-regulated permease PerM